MKKDRNQYSGYLKRYQRRNFLKAAMVSTGGLLFGKYKGYSLEKEELSFPEYQILPKTLQDIFQVIPREELEKSVLLACDWMTNISQVQTKMPDKDKHEIRYNYENWRGANRGEYMPGEKWKFFGPVWHTEQGVKALALAYKYFKKPYLLESARLGAEFILNQQVTEKNDIDYGMVEAYEDDVDKLNTSAVLESCDGLFTLSEVTGEMKYAERALEAIDWVVRRCYLGDGIFENQYDVKNSKGLNPWPNKYNDPGRPLLDDGVLLKAWGYSKNEKYRKVFYETADKLLRREEAKGNFIGYNPANWEKGYLHPRHAFWWGRPMWMAYKDSGDIKYGECFNRSCQWYTKAMRQDGGIIRQTYVDFNTLSFGHATSGVSCAVLMYRDAFVELGNSRYIPFIIKGLSYVISMQVTNAQDPNMAGVIIEKCHPPGGTDAVPWAVRDIGTHFFVTAATQILLVTESSAKYR